MNKTLFKADKYKVVHFFELVDGDFFVLDGKLYMKQGGLASCLSICDENGDYDHIPQDTLVTKATSFTVARL